MMMECIRCYALLLLIASAIHNFRLTEAASTDKHAEALISWLRAEEGFYNDKLEIRRADMDDPDSRFGMFATGNMKKNELLLVIPPSIILNSGESEVNYDYPLNCGTAKNLIKEMRLGDDSKYAPYVNYLIDTQPPGMLPSAWSKEAQDLLTDVLGEDLPPSYPYDWIDDWTGQCKGSKDPFEVHAAFLVVQRSWDDLLLPVYDMMSHRNGQWLNTESNNVHEGEPVRVRASRDIEAGEEIYTTYNFCEDCGAREFNYGTPEILRDYGFVEQFPQRWIFHDHDVAFELDEIYDEDGDGTGEYEITEWIEDRMSEEGVEELEDELVRLKDLLENDLWGYDSTSGMTQGEFNTIQQFCEAMILAIEIMLDTAEFEDDSCIEDGTCQLGLDRYDDLEIETEGLEYLTKSCDIDKVFEPFEDGVYEEIEEIQSPYQNIIFFQDPGNLDTCFELDGTVQICGSYRPHYHESVVHYSARFLDSIKRVLFVGGGDSMLLHEILKYPDLEFVVGLELDQMVTRHSFKYFGTQPHYNNEKVQWWYGDASKSLLMLPAEYFGSFDMVLVDLSETVMSFKVTSKLDIMEALSLLLKPEGIFVKNEHYLPKLSNMFKYSLEIHWYDNPAICSQALILGSNKVDFMKRKRKDHGVDNLLIKPLHEIEDQYELYHDVRKNETSVQLCNRDGNEFEKESITQDRSPGILMIVEAEDVGVQLKSSEVMKKILVKALESVGLTVLSTTLPKDDSSGPLTVAVMEEGYVVARAYPDHKYCAFDIHMWSSFDKHEDVKKAVLSAFGSGSDSSFRIIAGGMFGVGSWREDEKKRGPRFTLECEEKEETIHGTEVDHSVAKTLLSEAMNILPGDDNVVAVLCGDDTCNYADILKKDENVGEVLVLNCPDVGDINEYTEDALGVLFACEKHLLNTILDNVGEDLKKISSVVTDPSSSSQLAQILLKVFSSKRANKRMLMEQVLFISIIASNSAWEYNFNKRVLQDIFVYEPTYYANVIIKESSKNSRILFTSYGDKGFVKKLQNYVDVLETANGFETEVHDITGGRFNFQPDFVPSHMYYPKDYNQAPSVEQWKSQKPLGHQTIFQLESKFPSFAESDVREALEATLLMMTNTFSSIEESIIFEEVVDVGKGAIFIAIWSDGNAMVLWDGNLHVDINLFLYNESVENAKKFEKAFISKLSILKSVLRDEQPRGTGNVVNLQKDLSPRDQPYFE